MRDHVWHVFKKDGLELLRDRRTLFVNVLLPVLLYPLMLLFLIQVWQLTRAQKTPAPRVAVVDVEPALVAFLKDPPPEVQPGEATPPAATPASPATVAEEPKPESGRPKPVVIEPAPEVLVELRTLARAVDAAEIAATAAENEAKASKGKVDPEVRARQDAARAALLARIRGDDLAAIYVLVDLSGPADAAVGRHRVLAAKDDAHSEYDDARYAVGLAIHAYERDLQKRALAAVQLDERALDLVDSQPVELAPRAQSTRSRLAGIIPLLLVIMAVSAAFYPAIDLLAGERERGTLESLLSWPVKRKDLFVGKLLVTIAAATISVVLNICSLGFTVVLAGSQLVSSSGAGGNFSGLGAIGAGTLVLSFIALLPVIIAISAVSLALGGRAASAKEAQNYLTPVFLVVTMAAGVAMVPGARPNLALDLVPITGPVLALKEALRASSIPWLHLGLSTAASIALAAVIVSWSVRLLDSEAFCYPGLVRAGWGRFRVWGARQIAPSALEVMAVFAVCAAGFLLGSKVFANAPAAISVVGPLVLFVLLPPLVHAWLGDYPPQSTLHLARADRGSLLRGVLAIPLAVVSSLLIGDLQPKLPPSPDGADQMNTIITSIRAAGGLPLLLACVALAPAICEEVLCRGTLLSGMRHSLGKWGGVIMSSFLFAVLHLSPERFLPQFTIGIALGVLTLRSGSLLPAMIVHFGHNAALLLLQEWLGEGGGDPGPRDPQMVLAMVGVLALALVGLWFCCGGISRWVGPKAHKPLAHP